MNKLSKEEELEIINLFLNTKMSLNSIAKKYNRKSKDFIYSILDKYNINRKRRHISNVLEIEDVYNVLNLYQNQNMSIRQISKKYNVSESVVKRILIKNNVKIKKHYKYTFNEYYFDNIDTNNKAYLLGFLYADGCINKNNVISFTIHQKDKEILEMYIKELQATNKIDYIKEKQHVRISFCSKHMCDTLIKMGCGHNKTKSLSFPNIKDEYKYDFIRGFMDGDGCICISNRGEYKYINLSFTGTLEMMQELKVIFKVNNKISFYKNAYTLHIGKEKDVLRILKDIYNNAELFMSRKYYKYKEYIEWKEKV